MTDSLERNLGEQPIAAILKAKGLKPHDLVSVSSVPLTHKAVAKACKGRRLTPHMKWKVLEALNKAAGETYTLKDLFSY